MKNWTLILMTKNSKNGFRRAICEGNRSSEVWGVFVESDSVGLRRLVPGQRSLCDLSGPTIGNYTGSALQVSWGKLFPPHQTWSAGHMLELSGESQVQDSRSHRPAMFRHIPAS